MRKKEVIKRRILPPDGKFASPIITQLINKVMWDGEKRKARKIVYQAVQAVEKKTSLPPLTILEGALANTKPSIELKSWKMGGTKRQIPIVIKREERSLSLALRWMVESAREKKSSQPFFQHLAEEIVDAYNKKGGAWQKKETIQKTGEENKAFTVFLNRNAR